MKTALSESNRIITFESLPRGRRGLQDHSAPGARRRQAANRDQRGPAPARIAAGFALGLGALLYLARPTDPAAFGWLDRSSLRAFANGARALRHAVYAHVDLPGWFRGSASDIAYAFALSALLADAPWLIVTLGLVLVLGHEIAQGLGLAAGTFDPLDLFLFAISFLFAQLIFRSSEGSSS